jgi:hypothetical protein
MADKSNPYKKLWSGTKGEEEPPEEPPVEGKPSEEKPAAKPKASRRKAKPKDEPKVEATTSTPVAPAKPLSKRQDPEWFTRTYYCKRSTDMEVEEELLALKRQGVEMDKSDLVEALLSSWVEYRRGMAPAAAWKRVSPKREE